VPQRQQSAIISHRRIDIGAWHSGQVHMTASPSSHTLLPVGGVRVSIDWGGADPDSAE
jgi:hypothetical protein